MHEFTMDDHGLAAHEMSFSSGSSLIFVFERFDFEEQVIEQAE